MDNQYPTNPNQGGMGGGQAPVADPNAGQGTPVPEAPVSEPTAPVEPVSTPGMPGGDTGMGGGDQGGQNPAGGTPVV